MCTITSRALRPSDINGLVTNMNKLNLQVMVNLSGGNGSGLKTMLGNIRETALNVSVLANISFGGIGEPGWTEKLCSNWPKM